MAKGGPATEGGKEVVRWNAIRHGIRSPAPVVPGLEKAEDWEEHRSGVLESLSPEGHLENVLAERVALLSWRLHRMTRYERETIALSQERVEEDLARRRRFDSDDLGDKRPPANVREAYEYARNRQRLLKRLPTLPDDKHLSPKDAKAILWAIWDQVGVEVELEEINIPGVPGTLDVEFLEEYDVSWTVLLVREGISAIASSAGEKPEKLLEAATEEALRNVRLEKSKVEEAERDLKNMGRERLLPDEKTLEKIARYEAHLSRQLYQAMHELEALQTKRAGEAAPLARLDVQGLES
jgi:hypothetical protein